MIKYSKVRRDAIVKRVNYPEAQLVVFVAENICLLNEIGFLHTVPLDQFMANYELVA